MIRAVSYRLLRLHQASPKKDGTNTNKIGFPIEKRNLSHPKFGKKGVLAPTLSLILFDVAKLKPIEFRVMALPIKEFLVGS